MVQLRRLPSRLAVGLVAAALMLVDVPATAASPKPAPVPPDEHVQPAPGARMHRPDQLSQSSVEASLRSPASTAEAPARAADGVAPFMTRPYWGRHDVTSVFDHCNPDYSRDGVICDVDGRVARSSNGVDPTFSAGYAMTKGGTDYLYYDGHNGWDINLSYENLLAAASGVVQLAGSDPYNPGFGLSVTIDHQNGFTTRYAHLSQVWVSPGQAVKRGQGIGVSGNTGASTGPHLHFGLYINNPWTAIDPWGWAGPGADPWPADAGNKWITGNPQDPVPGPPLNVAATALTAGAARVTWSPPAFDGGDGVSQYTVTASPGGAKVTVPGTQTAASLSGLGNYTSYTFTVTAANGVGTGPASAPSNAVTPVPAFPGRYHPVAPQRVLDTRDGTGGLRTLGGNQTAQVSLAGAGGLPASGMTAVVLNLTATSATGPGYLTVFPGGDVPNASNLNYGPGAAVAGLVTSAVSGGGNVSIYNGSPESVDVIADVQGWYSEPASTGPDGHYVPMMPVRLLDTRDGTGGPRAAVAQGQTANLQVAGRGGVPATGAAAVVVNVTVTNPTASSYVSVFPTGQRSGQVSTVNFVGGQTIANRAIVKLAGGTLGIYNSQGSADVIVDVEGYFTDGAGAIPGGLFTGLFPTRAVDTRNGGGALGPGWRTVALAGNYGLPATTAPAPPKAVVLSVTATNAGQPTYIYVDPRGDAVRASDLNVVPGANASNLVVAPLGADGSVRVYNSAGQVDLIIDVVGWYS